MSSFLALAFPTPLPADPLLIAAASDLAPAEASLSRAASQTLGFPVKFALGSSGQLASQIRNGAPYDVYLSANIAFVRGLAASHHLDPASVRTYATGRLALYSPRRRFDSPQQLADPTILHIAIANPAHAPYGVAARQFLERAGLWDAITSRIVYGENVRQAFQFAESGNAGAALIAWTLVKDKPALLLPESGHDPIAQGAGVIARSGQIANARRFVDWLIAPEGQAILRQAGLFPPPAPAQSSNPAAKATKPARKPVRKSTRPKRR
ncbi:MAG: molybdate ABC transporter substrate-binding protein [Bryobacteraceae bacterium]